MAPITQKKRARDIGICNWGVSKDQESSWMRGDIEKRTNIRAIILRAIGTSKNHSRVPFRFESAELLDCDPTTIFPVVAGARVYSRPAPKPIDIPTFSPLSCRKVFETRSLLMNRTSRLATGQALVRFFARKLVEREGADETRYSAVTGTALMLRTIDHGSNWRVCLSTNKNEHRNRL